MTNTNTSRRTRADKELARLQRAASEAGLRYSQAILEHDAALAAYRAAHNAVLTFERAEAAEEQLDVAEAARAAEVRRLFER